MSMSRTFHEHRTFLLAALAGAVATMIAFAGLSRAESVPLPSIYFASASAAPLHAVMPSAPVFALAGVADAGPLPDGGVEPAPVPAPTLPPAADIPDPEQNPGGFIDAALLFWRSGGKVPTVLVALIGLMAVLKRHIEWLSVGWRATAVGVAGVLVATLLDTWFSSGAAGNVWSWLFGGIVGVVTYLANPRQAKAA